MPDNKALDTDAISVMGTLAIVMPLVAIIIAAAMILFAKVAITKDWLR